RYSPPRARRLLSTTRIGRRGGLDVRAVRSGLSLTSVLVPTATASHRPRRAWTTAVAALLVTRTGWPLRPATFPSALWAHLSVTYGRFRRVRAKNGAMSCRHWLSSRPTST